MSRHPGKRLSPWRVLIGIGVVLVLAASAWAVPVVLHESALASPEEPAPVWFGGYLDATVDSAERSPALVAGDSENIVLAFVVAAAPDRCVPSWGAAYSLDEAATALDLDRRIARLRAQGSDIAVSFGGAINTELAGACLTVDELTAAYGEVIDRYGVSVLDLDIEADDLADREAGLRRAQAVARLQRDNPALQVWLTLPVATDGLTADGLAVVRQMQTADVELAGVNAMTMNYGTLPDDASMAEAAIDALTAAHDQLGAQNARLGIRRDVWQMLGATPMIGQNDIAGEVFTLADAARLNAFATEKGLSRLSMWSLNRDRTCGENYPNTAIVSTQCSGVDQGDDTFAAVLSQGFDGRPDPTPTARPSATVAPTASPDDPATSPYPIWSPDATYSAGVKVVWHRNVYVAKWWTEGVPEPDDPTLAPNETAWSLIGPVLPGDPPYALPTLPPGTYPDWSATEIYRAGARVLVDGVPFEAKWWTQGEDPSAALTDRSRAAWRLLEEEPPEG